MNMVSYPLCKFLLSLLIISFVSTPGYAEYYPYDNPIDITSSGNTIGHVTPYQIKSFVGDYAYIKWQRQGYPEGNTYPAFLIKGTTIPLVFGIDMEFLNVKVNDVTPTGVDITIDKSNLRETVKTTVESVPVNVASISTETNKKAQETTNSINTGIGQTKNFVQESTNSLNKEIEQMNNQLSQRTTKLINRGYYSSLHIVDIQDATSIAVSKSVNEREVLLAENVADKIIPLVLDMFVMGTLPVTGAMYNEVVKQIPLPIRHQISNYLLNIDTQYDGQHTDPGLNGKAVFALYIGNPSINSLSYAINSELSKEGLPYFDGGKIIGKRTYSESSIGLIAYVPQERVWTQNTLTNRWNNDNVRLYKVIIAGIGTEGTKAAGQWYNDQIDLTRNLITNTFSMNNDLDTQAVLEIAKNTATSNPEAAISSAALLQGWTLNAMSSLQTSGSNNMDSLGFVVIVKKDSTGYDVLETHTINGYKKDVFLNDYDFEAITTAAQSANKINEAIKNPEDAVDEITTNNNGAKKVTGEVVKEVGGEPSSNFAEKLMLKAISVLNWLFGGAYG